MHKSKKFFILTLFLFTLFSGKMFSQDVFYETDYINSKVYITSDQLVVSDKGLFVLLEDASGLLTKTLVPQVNYDENGLFISAEHLPSPQVLERCPKGHVASCPKCFRCQVSSCRFRCKGH